MSPTGLGNRIPCPTCGIDRSHVVDTRGRRSKTWRRRECPNGHRYTTTEVIDPTSIVRGSKPKAERGHVWFGGAP